MNATQESPESIQLTLYIHRFPIWGYNQPIHSRQFHFSHCWHSHSSTSHIQNCTKVLEVLQTTLVSKLLRWLLLSCPLCESTVEFTHSCINKIYWAATILHNSAQGTGYTTKKQEDETAAFPEPPKFPECWRICSFLRLQNLSHGWQFRWPRHSPPRHKTQPLPLFPPLTRSHATTAGHSKEACLRTFLLSISLSLFLLLLSKLQALRSSDFQRTKGRNFRQHKTLQRTSLVAQWLRICLPMQGTQVRALVWENPTCRGATKPVTHNYWAWALKPASHNYWAHMPQLLKPTRLEPALCNKRSHHSEKPAHHNEE